MEKGEPIPFILINESVEGQKEADYTFKIHPKAHEVFNSDLVRNKKVAIAAVAGPQRTGKSFLSNRLLKRMKGFEIGPTTMPCTKGLWIWGEPIKVNEDTVLIIMDTQGLNSVQRDVNVDMKIFSLSILLSSVFIYNSIGHIDEKALENMSYVLRISENIKVSGDNDQQAEMGKYFPYFYWVLRDFSLDLKGKSEGEYLEDSLKPVSKDEKDPRNQIRSKIRKLFQHRRCECFPRPVHEEHRLAHIEELKYEQLRDSFRQKMRLFERTFFANLPPKTINNKPLTGSIYLNLAYQYVNAMNSGKVPKILNSLQGVMVSQTRKICDNYKNIYKKNMDQITKADKLPIQASQIEASYKKFLGLIQQKFDEKFRLWNDIKLIQEIKNKFFSDLAKDLENRLKQNNRQAEIKANKLLQKLFEQFKSSDINSIDQITTSLVAEKQSEFNEKLKAYDKEAKAPAKYVVFMNKIPPIIFNFFGMLIAKITRIYNEQLKNTEHNANDLRQELESKVRICDRLNELVEEKERETARLIFEKDKMAREVDAKHELNDYLNSIKPMSKKDKNHELESLKVQNLELRNKYEQALDMNQMLRNENQLLKTKNRTVRERMQAPQNDDDDQLDEKVQKIPSNLPHEIVSTLINLRSQLSIMNDFYDKKAKDETIQEYMQRQIDQIRKNKYAQIEKIKDEYRTKAEILRHKMQENKKEYEKHLEIMNKHLDDIKKENIDLMKRQNENPGNDQKMKFFNAERKKLEESLRIKQEHLNSQKAISHEREQEIQNMKEVLIKLENQLAIAVSERANLQSSKEDYWYLLRQSLQYVTGKNNSVKHAFGKLNSSDKQQAKKLLNNCGIKI